MHQKLLETGLRPDPLRELIALLIALPRALAGFKEKEPDRKEGGQGRERVEERGTGGRGATGKGGDRKEGNLAPTVISKSRRLCSTLVQLGLIKKR